MYYWLAVTSDIYELPLAVSTTARELAELMGTTKGNIEARRKYDGSKTGWKVAVVGSGNGNG